MVAILSRRSIIAVVTIPGLCFVSLNLLTALRAKVPRDTSGNLMGQTKASGAAILRNFAINASNTDALLEEAGRYSKLVLAEARRGKQSHAPQSSAADRVERQMIAAEAAAARLNEAAASAERAMRLLSGALEKSSSRWGLERSIDELAVCWRVHVPRNRTLCVAPRVQVNARVRVRLMPKAERSGRRAFFLLTQGLRQHPAVELVGSAPRLCADRSYSLDRNSRCEPDETKIGENHSATADLAIFISPATDPKFYNSPRGLLAYSPYRWETNKHLAMNPVVSIGNASRINTKHPDENPTLFRYQPPVPRERVVFVDECDWQSPHPHVSPPYLAYFKRSWVLKRDSVPTGPATNPITDVSMRPNYFPTPYAIADQYLDPSLPEISGKRDLDVLCTLRDTRGGRSRVLSWLRNHFADHLSFKVIIGTLSSAGRAAIDKLYLRTMRRAKIIVTCNPTDWEGDFRLLEALSSGALVFVDHMLTPYHHPLVDGEHLVYYDNTNQTDLVAKLSHALHHPRWARAVALRGYIHVLKHHRAVSWVDYIVRTALAALANDDSAFSETGQSVLRRTKPAAVVTRRRHGGLATTSADLADDDAGPNYTSFNDIR